MADTHTTWQFADGGNQTHGLHSERHRVYGIPERATLEAQETGPSFLGLGVVEGIDYMEAWNLG